MNIIAAILVFGFIVFIHELGHFYFAKRAGVTIHEFSIGMGPKLFGFEKDGIVYNIRLLPIGGYVAMEGEDEDSDDPNSFEKKSIKERFLSIVAGPLANILLCIILFIPFFAILGTPGTTFEKVLPKSPSAVAGIKAGDKIVDIDGNKINSFNELTKTIVDSNGKKLNITIERNGKELEKVVKPEKMSGKYMIGIQPKYERNLLKVIPHAIYTTYDISKTMLNFLWQLVTGQLSGNVMNSLSGPVGVIKMVSTAASTGFLNLVYFTALISLNIGIFNLLPIPALDGWRILVLFIEFLRGGKKLPSKVEGYINGAGLFVLLAFMLFITYKDILRIFF